MDFLEEQVKFPTETVSKGKVLLAEDNDTIRKMLKKLLSSNGYEVTDVDNGLEAKSSLAEDSFDIVLSDILMPGIDGITLLKEVRDNYGNIPVILITGNQSMENAKEAIHWGAFDYITKPFTDLSVILHSVKRAAFRGRLQRDKERLISELDRKNIHLKNVVRELDRKNARMDLLVYDLEWSMKLGNILTSEIKIDKMIDGMADGMLAIFDACIWGTLFYEPDGSSRLIIYQTGESPGIEEKHIVHIAIQDFKRYSDILLMEDQIEVKKKVNMLSAFHIQNPQYHSAPLMASEKVLGLMYLFADIKGDSEQSKKQSLALISSQFSAALENAYLFNQLEERNKKLKELSDFKDEILGIAAHDLRSPISAISMSATLLKDFADKMSSEEKTEAIEGIVHKSKHLAKMLNEILDISVIESGNLVLKKQAEEMPKVIEEHYHQVAAVARSKNIDIICNIGQNLPNVSVDKGKLGEVLDNLLTNAIKYTPSGGTVTVSAQIHENSILVSVEDSGVGIKESELKKLFKKFSRTSSRPTAGESSIGLGLSIAKKIVDMHGGTIGADSVYGKGSRFYFTIPLEHSEK